MTQPFNSQYKIRRAQGEHGADLDQIKLSIDKLHSIPQLEAGLDGKLRRAAPKLRELTAGERHTNALLALASCVAEAEGDFIHETIKKIFRDDNICLSYNRRYKMLLAGDINPMAKMLSELQIKIEHEGPPEEYDQPDDVALYRRLVISKGDVIRGERFWEWTAAIK